MLSLCSEVWYSYWRPFCPLRQELHAEVMDRRCRFLEAAQRYYNLSFRYYAGFEPLCTAGWALMVWVPGRPRIVLPSRMTLIQRLRFYCSPYPYNAARSTQEERRTLFLERAVTCAILASAGPQRSRMLATLYKDDRTHKLPVFGVLKKMYVGALCRRVYVLDCCPCSATGRFMYCEMV
jgi:hypothetical protein